MDSNTFALGLITLLIAGGSVLLWQVFATARARMAGKREDAYRQLVEQTNERLPQLNERLQEVARELHELRRRIDQLEPSQPQRD